MRLAAFAIVISFGCGVPVDLGGTGGTSSDAQPTTTCGALVAPTVDAGCRACEKTSSDCQPNGCYGGYWCNTSSIDCATPPTTCP